MSDVDELARRVWRASPGGDDRARDAVERRVLATPHGSAVRRRRVRPGGVVTALGIAGVAVSLWVAMPRGGERPPPVATPAAAVVEFPSPDRAAAGRLVVVGGSVRQRRAVRAAFAVAGRPGTVRRVVFNRRRVDVRTARTPGASPIARAWWFDLLAEEITLRLRAGGAPAGAVRIVEAGRARTAYVGRPPAIGRRDVADRVLAEARDRGMIVRRLRVLPTTGPAAEVTVELTDAQILAGTGVAPLLEPRTDGIALLVVTTSRTGQVIARDMRSRSASGGATEPVARLRSPELPTTGPTRVEIRLSRTDVPDATARPWAVLDCDGGTSRGVADVPAACTALHTGWLRLLPPESTACDGVLRVPAVVITGTLAGMRVERGVGTCALPTGRAWVALVGGGAPGG